MSDKELEEQERLKQEKEEERRKRQEQRHQMQIVHLNEYLKLMYEFLGFTKNGREVDQSQVMLLSSFIKSDDNSKDYSMSAEDFFIDKAGQAYSMAFFGFSSQKSNAFASTTFGSRINDDVTYNNITQFLVNHTEQNNVFKYQINQEEWLLNKLEELHKETDLDKKNSMMMMLPEVIIVPEDVKFSPRIAELLCEYNVRVQGVGKVKKDNCLDLDNAVIYDYKTGMQKLSEESDLGKAMMQINTEVAIEKIRKLRIIQKTRIKELENQTIGMQSNEAVDYILNGLEELYREYDEDTYNHIIGMKQAISTLDLGLPEEQKLTDVERKNLERMVILHDVGKLSTPKQVVASTKGIFGYERDIMNLHVSLDSVAMFNNETINQLLNLAINHHMGIDLEQYNQLLDLRDKEKETMLVSNTGYGDRRTHIYSNEKLVQMLHVIDVYNALSAERSYKTGFDKATTTKFMREDVQKGKMNGELVDYLLKGVELEEQMKKSA